MREEKAALIIRAGCFECAEDISFGNENNTFVLFTVLSGWLKVNIGGEDFLLCENNIILKARESALSVSSSESERATVLFVEFKSGILKKADIFDRLIPLGREKRRYLGEIIREMSRRCDDETELTYDASLKEELFGERIILEGALASLLVRIIRDEILGESDSEEDFEVRNQAQALRRYLYENYKTKITLDSLCFLFRSNKTTVCKQFRDEYGITVFAYLNSLRLKEAKRLITEGRQSITEIAFSLGFESIHYFTRFFKKMTGKTPTEYARLVCGWRKNLANE